MRRFAGLALAFACAGCGEPPTVSSEIATFSCERKANCLTIRVADNGDYSLDFKGIGRVKKDGVEYQFRPIRGETRSIRTDDLNKFREAAAAHNERRFANVRKMKTVDTSRPLQMPNGSHVELNFGASPGFALVEAGTGSAGGTMGKRFLLRRLGGQYADVEVLLNEESRFARLASLQRLHFNFGEKVRPDSYEGKSKEIFSRGLVLRFGNELELEHIQRGETESSVFDPPGLVYCRNNLEVDVKLARTHGLVSIPFFSGTRSEVEAAGGRR